MKRTWVALTLLAGLLPGLVRGQASVVSQIAGDAAATDRFHFGLKAGFSCGRLKGLEGVERRGGANFGLQATVALSPRLSLVPEVTFVSPKGATAIPFVTTGDPGLDPFFADPARSALELGYVDVPVQVRWRLGRFHLGAGGYAGFLVSAREKFRAERPDGEELLFAADVADDFRKTDFGLLLEASWTITKPRRGAGLVFHIRWQEGLADVLEDYSGPLAVLLGGNVRTSGIQVFLTFPFVR